LGKFTIFNENRNSKSYKVSMGVHFPCAHMNTPQIISMVALFAAMIGMVGITTTTMTAFASTSGPEENTRNDFGEDASEDLADDGEMGTHSSDPAPGKRSGIGNVFNEGDPKDDSDSKHPSDTGNRLCEGSSNSACTDEGDPND
jgi:hypothetical protein